MPWLKHFSKCGTYFKDIKAPFLCTCRYIMSVDVVGNYSLHMSHLYNNNSKNNYYNKTKIATTSKKRKLQKPTTTKAAKKYHHQQQQ